MVIEVIKEDPELYCLIITYTDSINYIDSCDKENFNDQVTYESLNNIIDAVRCFKEIYSAPIPVLYAIDGEVIFGGLELALVCDLITLTENSFLKILLFDKERNYFLTSIHRLSMRIGVSRVKDLVFTGRIVKAREAQVIGLVDKIVSNERLMIETLGIAYNIIKQNNTTIRLLKESLIDSIETNFNQC